MIATIEDDLRTLLADDAERAPGPETAAALGIRAREAGQLRRQQRTLWTYRATGAVLAAACAAAVTYGVWGAPDHPASTRPDDRVATDTNQQPPERGAALPDARFARCTLPYSPANLVTVSPVAFDGTVLSVADAAANRGTGSEDLYVAVSFKVSEWFKGGQGPTATVDMLPPDVQAEDSTPASYEIGDRLLISGGLPDGAGKSAVPVAEGCGFSRHYDEVTATQWRDAYR